MHWSRWFKAGFGVLMAGASVWAFWPEPAREGEVTGTAFGIGPENAAFTIDVFPGLNYMPGTIPSGFGEPLRGFAEVARDFVERFPDTRINFRNVPTNDREWMVTQLMSANAPDIIAVNVEDVWVDIGKSPPWYISLDDYLDKPNPFVPAGQPGSEKWWDQFRYQTISRGKAAPNGKMYCVTFDMVETGIYYNKTQFERLGIAPPATWAEFDAIQQRIREAGYIPFQTDIEAISDWGVDLILDQVYADILPGIDLTQDPIREQYLKGYLDWDEVVVLHEKGFFTSSDPRYRELFRLLRDWRRHWNEDLGFRSLERVRAFIRQDALMIWDGSWSVQRFAMDRSLGFEWGVFYLPPITLESSPFGPGTDHPMSVIGGAGGQFSVTNRAFADTGDPATSRRLERVIQFMQFVCLPENASRVTNETLQFISNIVGVEPRPQMKPFADILEREYGTTKWKFTFDLQFTDALQRMLLLYLNDGTDLDGFLATMDGFLDLAAERAVERNAADLAPLEQRWRELTPLRATLAKPEELPHGAR